MGVNPKMRKRDTSESDSESEGASASSPGSESETVVGNNNNGKGQRQGVSEYEEQRLRRIAENRARLEALGLSQIAFSLKKSLPRVKKKKGKEKKVLDDDEEYIPEDEGEEPGSGSSSEQDDTENASGSRKRKVKNQDLKMKGRVSEKKHGANSEYIDDEDDALRQAIALSLQDTAEVSYCSDKNVGNIIKAETKGNIQEDKGRKNKKSFTSRLQMTEDELILHFFQLDEAGKGTVTIRDLERAATAHDFIWTDKEVVDMIRFFDNDGDGKLSFEDFRKIVVRCNLMKGSENS